MVDAAAAQPLARDAGRNLSDQLADRYAQRITQGLLLPGAKLPSVRDAAKRHAVSPSTVVATYDQLLARGLVAALPKRGYYVRETVHATAHARVREKADQAAAPVQPQAPIDATALIRGMFHNVTRESAPGLGTLPIAWLDLPMLHSALRRAMADDKLQSSSLKYGDPAGDAKLRESLTIMMNGIGIAANTAQVITTSGASHALDIISRAVLRPGDAVLVDEPGWAIEHARLQRMGMRLLPVPRGLDGPNLEVMRNMMQQHKPRLYVTVSVLHNPTGANLSVGVAHQVLQLAEAHDVLIVEDDTYALFTHPHLPRLSALDGLRRTMYVSGFSKIMVPGWRVGYMAVPRALVHAVVDTKLLSGLTSPALMERAMAHCIDQGALRRHAERVSQQLQAARARTQRLALDAGCTFVTPPQGLFGWVDTGVDTERLAQSMLDEGWLIAPGRLFHVAGLPSTCMRINFATSQDAKFWRAFVAVRGR
jgi:DNA-binding transcriptional MocR family regulator